MNKDSFITILPFMVTDLNLKGNELLVYAIIHGFSLDEESDFHGSLQYLCEWTNSTKQGIMKNLASLVKKDLIKKTEVYENGIKYCRYTTCGGGKQSLTVCNKVSQGGKQSLTGYATKFNGGMQQSLPNNKYNNKDIINLDNKENEKKTSARKTREFVRPTLEEIQSFVTEKNLSVDAKQFFDYFEVGGWVDSKGNKVKNWKQKILTWNRFNNSAPKKEPAQNYVTYTNNEKVDISECPF